MKRLLACLLLLAATGTARQAWAALCPSEGWTLASLETLKARSFQMAGPSERMALAEELLPCLADPDPALRDGIAYEALSQWMRAGDFDPEALRATPFHQAVVIPGADDAALWLARRHDLVAFLSSLYLQADRSDDQRITALKPAIVAALDQVD